MKKIKKGLCVLLFSVLVFSFCELINGAENNQDGLDITLTTNNKNYNDGDCIEVDLSIKNNNDYIVTLNYIENIIPDNFQLTNKYVNRLENQQLNIGEVIHLKTKLEKKDFHDIIAEVNTGDMSNIEFWLELMLLGISIIFIFLFIKYRNIRSFFIILLVFGVTIGLLGVDIEAKNEIMLINLEENVKYNGENLKIKSSVAYTKDSSQKPDDPIVYQDGVEETYLDYILDEENSEIIILNGDLISEWQVNQIQVLKSEKTPEDDIAIKILSIEDLEGNKKLIKYMNPDISEVVSSINYYGVESETGVIIPAEGVTFSDSAMNGKKMRFATFELYEVSGTYDLFKKRDFSFKKDGIEFNGELCVERINYAFECTSNLFDFKFNKAYMTLDSSLTVGMEVKNNFGGEKKIKLATFESPIGYGFFAVGDIYAYISASGEVLIEYTVNATGGFDYSKGNYRGIWEIQGDLSEAKANVNLKIGTTFEPKVSFLKIGLIGAEFDFGRNYKLDLDDISLAPVEYCLDMGYYNYANVSSILLPGSWDKKFTAILMDEDDDYMNEVQHIEEIGFVDECTRKYGSLEGTVLKHIGAENLPLYLADVILKKDGKEIFTTVSGSDGKFSFPKEIEKGNYEIIVRCRTYESYKGNVTILGNKENKIENPIILEPEESTVTVEGNIYNIVSKQPIANATVSVAGYVDRSTKTDSDGNYQLEVPVGNQTIIASADTYSSKSYTTNFNIGLKDINIGLTREYEYEVVTINAGESYQFDFNTDKRIFVRSENLTEYSSYLDGDLTYHRKDYQGEFYSNVSMGEHWEIKVFEGSLTIFANDGSFYESPDSNISDYCNYSSMNGVDPLMSFTLSEGDTKTFDNQIDAPKNKSFTIYCFSAGEVIGTTKLTDYYYNTHFGYDINEYIYDINGVENSWRAINNLSKVEISISSGELLVYYYRLDDITVY